MNPIRQERYGLDPDGEPLGDCFRAAVASLFERELTDVPDFMDPNVWGDGAVDWWADFSDWMVDEYGLVPVLEVAEDHPADGAYGIALGETPNLRRPHAVVVEGTDTVWNPGTGDETPLGEIDYVVRFATIPTVFEALVADRNEVRSWRT